MPRVKAAGSDKPKGRTTSYAFFVQTCRDEHKKLHPDENVQFAEFSRQCSERWKTMSDKEKNKFHEMADNDKVRHDKEMANWTPPPGETKGRRARRPRGAKKEKDPNKPKRALSAFFYYANVERPKVRAANPDFSVGEVAKELGRQWNELTSDVKAPFEKEASDDRARYDEAMKAYKAGESPMKKAKTEKTEKTNGHKAPAPEPEPESEEEEDEEAADDSDQEPEAESDEASDDDDE
ncbi:unnamed protein product [Meganyctiphanes norvegica]|uniref:HMG box domain-containing protein n=1 Tax=Meganyctiphanes norvegica TaxID=48144 RepID=A0AAV2RQ68_MEGNR